MELNLIYARARNGVIGKDGQLPWYLPEDMAHFRATTMGGVVIMGRKTFQSLPGPLAGRVNVVVTRDPALPLPGANVYRAASFKEALVIARRVCSMGEARETWVIGGAEIYKEAMPYATRIEVTEIDADYEGDTTMPKLSCLTWKKTLETEDRSASDGVNLKFVTYKRRQKVTEWAKTVAKYLMWVLSVQLIAWLPATLLTFNLIDTGTAATLSILLGTAGAIFLISLASQGKALFLKLTNRKE